MLSLSLYFSLFLSRFGKVRTITNSGNKVKTFAYDSMGRNKNVTDEMNGVSSVTYDKLGICGFLQIFLKLFTLACECIKIL